MRLFEIKREDYDRKLTVEEFVQLGRTAYSNYFKLYKQPVFYRGFTHVLPILTTVDASGKERESQNTTNEYTWLLSTLASWQKFPKRSRSLVGSTSSDYASQHSRSNLPGILITPNNAKIGVCPMHDIWESFKKYQKESLTILNYELKEIFQGFKLVPGDGAANTYDIFIKALRLANSKLNELKKTNPKLLNKLFGSRNLPLFDKFIKDTTQTPFIILIDKILTPRHNGFKLVTTETLGSVTGVKEMWTSDRCLVISPEDRIVQEPLATYTGIRNKILSRK